MINIKYLKHLPKNIVADKTNYDKTKSFSNACLKIDRACLKNAFCEECISQERFFKHALARPHPKPTIYHTTTPFVSYPHIKHILASLMRNSRERG